jgi:D-glycero-alpha-D-manno-heptose-7-phosphate kinase
MDKFKILETKSLREGLKCIDSNHHGAVFTVNEAGAVTGIATDGDIRRKLLENASLDDPIKIASNPNFFWANKGASREELLKKLDQRIKVIPVLDENMYLVKIISHTNLLIQEEGEIYARGISPVRVSFGGGGSDVTNYFSKGDGAVINATISLYSHATLRARADKRILIHSLDLDELLEADNLEEALQFSSSFGLIQALLRLIKPDFGFELLLHSDFPVKSGLGGSAAVSSAVLGCFNQFRSDRWDLHEMAELLFQAERFYFGIAGGWQDQYATVFGGFNFMEFKMDGNIVHPLRISEDVLRELEESLILCDTGITHDSGNIHEDQRKNTQHDDVNSKVQENVKLTYLLRNHLLRGQLSDFGKSMNEAWKLKRQFSNKISSPHLDQIYELAIKSGALGGKLLGAGGGGFFLFYVPPFSKFQVIETLKKTGLKIRPFKFDLEGLRSWSCRLQNLE